MGSWGYLRLGAGRFTRTALVDETPILLRSKYELPSLWAALLDVEAIEATPKSRLWFTVSVPEAAARLRALALASDADGFFSVVWESAWPMQDWLASLDTRSSLIVDLRELSTMYANGSMRQLVLQLARQFHELRSTWLAPTANELLPPCLKQAELPAATLAACRYWRVNRPREAFFCAAFGGVGDVAARDSRWTPWFDAGPAAVPLPDPREEGQHLAEFLAQRGLVVFHDTPRAQKHLPLFLTTALRDRRVETLVEVLTVMQAQGIVRELRGTPAELAQALATFATPA